MTKMKNRERAVGMSLVRCTAVAAVMMCGVVGAARATDIVLDWNEIATEVFVTNTSLQNPGMTSRTLAMLNLAMYDTINGIQPRYTPFYSHTPAPAGASVEAATIASAHEVLSGIYATDLTVQALLDTRRDLALALIPDSQAKTDGVSFGTMVGMNVVDHRQNDGFDVMKQYMPTGLPGDWAPDPTISPTQEAWGPGWGDLVPFTIDPSNLADFSPPPPPPLNSVPYTDAFNEVKALGAKNSPNRTQEQTNIGNFWAYDRLGMGTPMVLYNDIMRTLAEQQGNSLQDNARMFAMASVAMADAGIVAWESKFREDLWRPITGIRDAHLDGNAATERDEFWEALGAPGGSGPNFTPNFPTYISGHATFGGAMFEMLKMFYGTDDISFAVTSAELSGPAAMRTFNSFSEAMAENGRSRVYLGIHWNFDDTEGQIAGQNVANFIMWESGKFQQVVPEPNAALLALFGLAAIARRRATGR